MRPQFGTKTGFGALCNLSYGYGWCYVSACLLAAWAPSHCCEQWEIQTQWCGKSAAAWACKTHTHTRKQQLEPRQLNYKEIWQGSLKGLLQRLALDTFICKMLGVIAVIRCQHKTNLNAFGGINYHLCLLCEERYFPHQSKREFVPALVDTSWQLAMFQPPSVTESVKSPVLSTRLYTRIYCWKLTMAHKETYSHRLTIKQSRRKTEVSQYQSGTKGYEQSPLTFLILSIEVFFCKKSQL